MLMGPVHRVPTDHTRADIPSARRASAAAIRLFHRDDANRRSRERPGQGNPLARLRAKGAINRAGDLLA